MGAGSAAGPVERSLHGADPPTAHTIDLTRPGHLLPHERHRPGRAADDEPRFEPDVLGAMRRLAAPPRRGGGEPRRHPSDGSADGPSSGAGRRGRRGRCRRNRRRSRRRGCAAQLAGRAHRADRDRVAHGQDGRRPVAAGPRPLERGGAAVDRGSPGDDRGLRSARCRRPRVPRGNRCRRRPKTPGGPARRQRRRDPRRAITSDVPVAEREHVLRGCTSTGLVVDHDRAVLGQVVGVHEDHRQAGAADLLDLGMIGGQTDRDHAVDGRPTDAPERATRAGAR